LLLLVYSELSFVWFLRSLRSFLLFSVCVSFGDTCLLQLISCHLPFLVLHSSVMCYIHVPRLYRTNTDAILRATLSATCCLVTFRLLALADLRPRLVGSLGVTFWMTRRSVALNFGIPIPNSESNQTNFVQRSEVLTTAIGAGVETGCGCTVRGSNTGRDKGLFQNRPAWLWGPPSPLLSWYRLSFPGGIKRRGGGG
jgi:hypothetical protein